MPPRAGYFYVRHTNTMDSTPELPLEGPLTTQIESMRKTARSVRRMALLVLTITSLVMVAGGFVFFSAGDIVATDRTKILEEQSRHLKDAQLYVEKMRHDTEWALMEAEKSREEVRRLQTQRKSDEAKKGGTTQ